MKTPATILLGLFCSGGVVSASECLAPLARLEAKNPIVTTGEVVWMRVTLDHDTAGSQPILICEQLSAFVEDKPQTLVVLEIKDEAGTDVTPRRDSSITPVPFTATDLLTLWTGAVYGQTIALGLPPREFRLGPGRYRVRALVENRVRWHYEENAAALERLLEATGYTEAWLNRVFCDFAVASNEVEIEVRDEPR